MGRRKQYEVHLTPQDRQSLETITRKGQTPARVLTRAHALLHADEQRLDTQVAVALHVSTPLVAQVRRRYVQEGLEAALYERPRPGVAPKLGAQQTAILIAETCNAALKGQDTWTMQLLADRLVTLGVASISDETVRRVLKKTTSWTERHLSGLSASNHGRKRVGALAR